MTGSSKKEGATEDELWRSVKASTRPLGAKKRVAKPPSVKKSAKKKPASAKKKAAPKKQTPPRTGVKDVPAREAAKGTGHDRRSAQKLKRGQLVIDATLDLHGMTQDQAHRTLNATLPRAYRQGKRTVLVITGKGEDKEGGGVLRRNVPRWLGETPLAGIVLNHSEARTRDGGGGALYVSLRRERPGR